MFSANKPIRTLSSIIYKVLAFVKNILNQWDHLFISYHILMKYNGTEETKYKCKGIRK